jgi:tRNA pseudouridine38/39 synthase
MQLKTRVAGGLNLNSSAMQQAAQHLVGEHNFQNFCKMNLENTTQHVRCVVSASVETFPLSYIRKEDMLVFRIRGSSFLWHQARHTLSALAAALVYQNAAEIMLRQFDTALVDKLPGHGCASVFLCFTVLRRCIP